MHAQAGPRQVRVPGQGAHLDAVGPGGQPRAAHQVPHRHDEDEHRGGPDQDPARGVEDDDGEAEPEPDRDERSRLRPAG